jgi:uroporphyrinogen decarboxylase
MMGDGEKMQSRERALVSLNHSEPDRVPFDLGGMAQSGIHSIAYGNLRSHLGLPPSRTAVLNIITQAARIDADLKARLKIDTDLVYGRWADVTAIAPRDDGE